MEQIANALSNIGFDWKVALANLVNFIIIFIVLKYFAFGPLARLIEERRTKIREGVENAKQAEQERAQAEQAYAERLENAKAESREIIAGARKQEAQMVADAKKQAEREAVHIIRDAERAAEHEQRRMEEEFRTEAVDLVIAGTERVMRESVTPELNRTFIKNRIAESS